jgi:hypothetical protein
MTDVEVKHFMFISREVNVANVIDSVPRYILPNFNKTREISCIRC